MDKVLDSAINASTGTGILHEISIFIQLYSFLFQKNTMRLLALLWGREDLTFTLDSLRDCLYDTGTSFVPEWSSYCIHIIRLNGLA